MDMMLLACVWAHMERYCIFFYDLHHNGKPHQLSYPLVLLQLNFFPAVILICYFAPLRFQLFSVISWSMLVPWHGMPLWLFFFFCFSPQKSDIFSAVKLCSRCTEGKLITFSLRLPVLAENRNKCHHRGEFIFFATEVIEFCVCVPV